jgi:hypothetical protein
MVTPVLKEQVLHQIESLSLDNLARVARFLEFLQFQEEKLIVRKKAPGKRTAFGMWADRPEAQDPVAFAETLRRKIETRQDG